MRGFPHPFAIMQAMVMQHFGGGDDRDQRPDILDIMRGIKRYQNAERRARVDDGCNIFERNGVRLRSLSPLNGNDKTRPIIVFVPSMINSYHILDLTAQSSMMRWFEGQGYRCFYMDWSDFLVAQSDIGIDHIASDHVAYMVRALSEMYERRVSVVGHCMGGTLAAGAMPQLVDHVRGLVMLSAPWDFHHADFKLARDIRVYSDAALLQSDEDVGLSGRWVEVLFAQQNPHYLDKFARYADMAEGSQEAHRFVAVEDWLTHSPAMPRAVMQTVLNNWFTANAPYKTAWHVAGRAVNLDELACPIFNIASRQDKIVPYAATYCGENAVSLDTGLGHIGMVIGRKAVPKVYAPIQDWMLQL